VFYEIFLYEISFIVDSSSSVTAVQRSIKYGTCAVTVIIGRGLQDSIFTSISNPIITSEVTPRSH